MRTHGGPHPTFALKPNGNETHLGGWKDNRGTGAQQHKYILCQTDASGDNNIG